MLAIDATALAPTRTSTRCCQSIVVKTDGVVSLRDAIERYGWRVVVRGASHDDVVVGFAIPIAQAELVPLRRQTWRKGEAIHFQR